MTKAIVCRRDLIWGTSASTSTSTARPAATSSTHPAASACIVKAPKLQGKYDGPCVAGLAEGVGRAVGENTYEGAFSAGLPEGLGVYTFANGNRFEGMFANGKPNGKGKMELAARRNSRRNLREL